MIFWVDVVRWLELLFLLTRLFPLAEIERVGVKGHSWDCVGVKITETGGITTKLYQIALGYR